METRYKDNGDGTISDAKTGLVWQAEHAGPFLWEATMEYAKNLKLAGREDWRLPTIEELITLIDFTRANPASVFPGAVPYDFWSSSSYSENTSYVADDTAYAWYISFYNGSVILENKINNFKYTHCVRGGKQ